MSNNDYDIVIKNGTVIDPYQQIEEKKDIAVSKGKIVSVETTINSNSAKKVVDASGKIVTPGLIDLHTHVYDGVNVGVSADDYCLLKGTTTAVDAGTAGSHNFTNFRKYIIDKSKTRIIPLLNISSIGLVKGGLELIDIRELDFNGSLEMVNKNKDSIKGIKIRFASPPRTLGKSPVRNHVGNNGPVAMRLVRELADKTGGIVMVHPKSVTPGFGVDQVLKLLNKGDVFTHCFAPDYPYYYPYGEIINEKGEVLPEVKKAAERGVVFDVGHGNGSFSFITAKNAISDGFLPTTISTDLHRSSIKTAVDMPTTMSKFIALGIPLSTVVEMSTTVPAEILGLKETLGTLKPGAEADITILDLIKGHQTFYDVRGNSLDGDVLLKPNMVVKGGEIFPLS